MIGREEMDGHRLLSSHGRMGVIGSHKTRPLEPAESVDIPHPDLGRRRLERRSDPFNLDGVHSGNERRPHDNQPNVRRLDPSVKGESGGPNLHRRRPSIVDAALNDHCDRPLLEVDAYACSVSVVAGTVAGVGVAATSPPIDQGPHMLSGSHHECPIVHGGRKHVPLRVGVAQEHLHGSIADECGPIGRRHSHLVGPDSVAVSLGSRVPIEVLLRLPSPSGQGGQYQQRHNDKRGSTHRREVSPGLSSGGSPTYIMTVTHPRPGR